MTTELWVQGISMSVLTLSCLDSMLSSLWSYISYYLISVLLDTWSQDSVSNLILVSVWSMYYLSVTNMIYLLVTIAKSGIYECTLYISVLLLTLLRVSSISSKMSVRCYTSRIHTQLYVMSTSYLYCTSILLVTLVSDRVYSWSTYYVSMVWQPVVYL